MAQIITQIKALFQYRHLILELAIKDIKVRYRTPALGFLWAALVPLIMVFIFKFVFSTILNAQVENYPFFIYLMTAIFPWTYFASSIGSSIDSIVSNRELIKKTYFPRHIIPVSVVLANLINFIPALFVMLVILVLFKMPISDSTLLIPLILLIQTMFTIGVALIVASLQVVIRDVKYIMELLLLLWLYLSPALYSLKVVANFSERLLKLYLLNPFVGLFTFYRIALLKGYAQTLPLGINLFILSAWTIALSVSVFLLGFWVFRRYETQFSDLV